MPPTSGEASVAGYDIWQQSNDVKNVIGYLPENPPIYTDMRVTEYLDFVAKIKGIAGADRAAQIDNAMQKTSLHDVSKQVINSLSKGYRQRVGLAQALLGDPKVLILDEPTVGLDPRQIIEIRQLIKELGGDHTIILSTHILPEVEMTCDRVVIINEGEVVAQDTTENLTHRSSGREKTIVEVDADEEKFKSIIQPMSEILKIEKMSAKKNQKNRFSLESSSDIRRDLAQLLIEKGIGLYELRSEAYSLEDIFLHLTTKEEAAL